MLPVPSPRAPPGPGRPFASGDQTQVKSSNETITEADASASALLNLPGEVCGRLRPKRRVIRSRRAQGHEVDKR